METKEIFFPPWVVRLAGFVIRYRIAFLLAIGYGLCRCASGTGSAASIDSGSMLVADCGKVAGSLAIAAWALARDRESTSFTFFCTPFMVALVGAAVLVCSDTGIIAGEEIAMVGSFLFGFGTAAMMLQWLEFVAMIPLRQIVLSIGCAEMLNSGISLIAGITPSVSFVLLLSLLAGSFILLVCARFTLIDESATPLMRLRKGAFELSRLVSWKLLLWTGTYCFIFGFINAAVGFKMLSAFDNIGNLLPGLCVVLFALVMPEKLDIRSLKNIAFILMVIGLVVVGFLQARSDWFQVFAAAGTASCRLFAYSLACMRAFVNKSSALPACALVKVIIVITSILGSSVGAMTVLVDITVIVAFAVIVISVISVWLSPFDIWERDIMDHVTQTSLAAQRQELISRIAAERNLSEREITVFYLMVDGGDIAHISEELFITKGAVRAHMSRIYAKFEVHNRQELDELLERMAP